MRLHPFYKCFVFQIAHYEDAGHYPGTLAEFSKYQ